MQAATKLTLAPPSSTVELPALSMSVVCVEQTRLGEHLNALHAMGLSRLHVDITEPAFGGGLGLPLEILTDLRSSTRLPIDVHVMLTQPRPLLMEIAERGADAICVHQRALTSDTTEALRELAGVGVYVGLAIDPGEGIDPEVISTLRPHYVTVMSVVPGGAGRPFRHEALGTLIQAAQLRANGLIQRVEADGAVGPTTAPLLVSAGAEQLVLGSTIFPDRVPDRQRLTELQQALAMACTMPTLEGASA